MKKRLGLLLASLLVVGGLIYAGQNWSTSTGGAWRTPDDTSVTPNQFLVIGSTTAGQPIVAAVSQPWLQSQTAAQINASTASAVGQIAFCNDCIQAKVCIATGTSSSSQWQLISSSRSTVGACTGS